MLTVRDIRQILGRFSYYDSTNTLIKTCMLKQKCPCDDEKPLHWLSEITGVVFVIGVIRTIEAATSALPFVQIPHPCGMCVFIF